VRGGGRNGRWRAAKAPVVLFLDGDTVLDSNFIADSIAELNDPNMAVVFGNRREIAPEASIYNAYSIGTGLCLWALSTSAVATH